MPFSSLSLILRICNPDDDDDDRGFGDFLAVRNGAILLSKLEFLYRVNYYFRPCSLLKITILIH
ncbi:hypothetical protein HanRHA438_Chr03g0145321 [Helianthus annuus]|nr:hypothetical protein HanRHA438_Chr03g0145321 [Helianthus annuus]